MKAWLQGCATQWTCMHLAELVTGACTPLTCLLHAHLSQMHITASCHPPTSHASALHVCLCYSTETDKLPSLQLSRKKNQNHVRDPTKWTMQTNLTWCVWVHASHHDKCWNCPLYCKVFSTFSMQSLNTGCTASSFSVQKKRTFWIPFSSNKGKMRLTHVGPILKVWIWMKHKNCEKRVKSTGENIFIFFPPLPLVSHKNADPHCPHQARKFSIRLSEKEQKVLSKSTNVRSLNFGSRQRPAYSALLLIKVLGEKWLKRTDFCVYVWWTFSF